MSLVDVCTSALATLVFGLPVLGAGYSATQRLRRRQLSAHRAVDRESSRADNDNPVTLP